MPRAPMFYGWRIVAAMLVALMIGSGLSFWSFTVYIRPLEDEFGWSRAQVSTAFSVGVVISGLSAPFIGRVIDRIGGRRSIAFGCFGIALAFVLFSRVESLWQYLAVSGLQAFAFTWTNSLPFQWLIVQWFRRRRGLALGIATAGFGLGGSVVLPLIAFLVDRWGWRTSYLISGAIVLATYLPVALFVVRNRPQDLGLQPDGDPAPPAGREVAPQPAARTWTLGALARSRQFWLLASAQTFFFGALSSFGLHSVPFFEDEGRTATFAATVIAASSTIRTPARMVAGWALDRLPSFRWLAIGIALFHAGLMVLLVASTSLPAIVAFIVLWGLGGAFGPLLFSIVSARTFGTASFATVTGALIAAETGADVALPPLGGFLFDRLGNYDLAFLLYAASFVIAALAWFLFYLSPTPQPAPVASVPAPSLAAEP